MDVYSIDIDRWLIADDGVWVWYPLEEDYVPAATAQPMVPIAWAIRTSVVMLLRVCLDVSEEVYG
jgi:hypothetical protein